MNQTTGGWLVLGAAAGFGTIPIFGELAMNMGVNNPSLLSIRFLLAAIVLLTLLTAWQKGIPEASQIGAIVGLGIAYAAMTGAFFAGLVFLPAGTAAILLYTYPAYVYLIGIFILDEPISKEKVAALGLALTGMVLIVGFNQADFSLIGGGFVLIAAAGYAVYTLGNRVVTQSVDPLILATGAITTTGMCMLGYGIITDSLFWPQGYNQWTPVIGITVFGTIIPIVLFAVGLKHTSASNASTLAMAEPVVSVLLGIIILGESLSELQVLGGALVLFGIYLIQKQSDLVS